MSTQRRLVDHAVWVTQFNGIGCCHEIWGIALPNTLKGFPK